MAGEVNGVGKGFFTESGELKSKQQVAKESASEKSKESSDTVEISTPSPGEKLSSALSSVASRFREDVNKVATVVNRDEENADNAAKAVQEQLRAARELKAALKDKNDEKVQVAREKLERATEKRNQVAQQIKENNNEVVTERAQNLNVANKQIGIVRSEAVKLERTKERELETPKDVDKLIRELKSDKQDIAEQKKRVQATRDDLRAKAAQGEARIAESREASIRQFEEAESKAKDLAARITSNGSQALAANKISESIARQLL